MAILALIKKLSFFSVGETFSRDRFRKIAAKILSCKEVIINGIEI